MANNGESSSSNVTINQTTNLLNTIVNTKTCLIELFSSNIKCSSKAIYGLFDIQHKFICELHKEIFEKTTNNKLLDLQVSGKCAGCLKKMVPCFNVTGQTKGIFCQACAKEYMLVHPDIKLINVKNIKCIKCKKVDASLPDKDGKVRQFCRKCYDETYGKNNTFIPSYGKKICMECKNAESSYANEDKTFYSCGTCRTKKPIPGLIKMYKKCVSCSKTASFMIKSSGIQKATHCYECAISKYPKDDIEDIAHKKCEDCGLTQASYGLLSENKIRYCGVCAKKHGGIDLKNEMCEDCCVIHAHYNYEFESKPAYCLNCSKKYENMVPFQSHHCKGFDIKCNKRPTFGLSGTKNALYCKECGDKTGIKLINVMDNMCENCHILRSSFGPENGKFTHCANCNDLLKLGYKNTKKEICINCHEIRPIFGKINLDGILGSPTHCSECKNNLGLDLIDVVHKKCIECLKQGKYSRAEYSKLFSKPIHCYQHKCKDEINIPNPRCECGKKAFYGPNNSYIPIRCFDHSFKNDKSFEVFICECGNEDSYAPGDDNIKPRCATCRYDEILLRIKQKELNIKKLFNDNNIEYQSHDKIIEVTCSKKRPDFVFNSKTNTRVIIVEVDEYQHNKDGYTKDCEVLRMIELKQSFWQRPVTFIRYNPDIFYINKCPQFIEDDIRHNLLLTLLKKLLNDINDAPYSLDAYYMFYNEQKENTGIYEPIHRILLKHNE